MTKIYVEEEFVNETQGLRCGSSGIYESRFETPSQVYKFCLREWGRCKGKVFIDTKHGAKHIGWIFQKREKYTDVNETYLQETWVTLHTAPPVNTTSYSRMYLD